MRRPLAASVLLAGCAATAPPAPPPAAAVAFADSFDVAAADWVSAGRNPYFVLEPGYVLELAGEEHGEVARHGGSWRAGTDGARFGLMMPGSPAVGMRHYQELAPGVAMDRAEVVGVAVPFETPAGIFADCLAVEETSAIERGRETKLYARGVGLVKDGRLRLVRWGAAGR